MTNLELVQAALGAAVGRDADKAADVVADDFVWHIPGDSAIGGDVQGAQGWSDRLHTLLAAGLKPQLLAMLEGGDHVAVYQHNTAESGEHRLDVHVVNLFTVRDGKVARLDTFFSDQHAAETFWNAVLR